MKTLRCEELGGTCDEKLSASSWDDIVQRMTKHVMEKHPDVAKQMERMHNEDPQKWGRGRKHQKENTTLLSAQFSRCQSALFVFHN